MKIAIKLVKSFIALTLIFYVSYAVAYYPALARLIKQKFSPEAAANTNQEEATRTIADLPTGQSVQAGTSATPTAGGTTSSSAQRDTSAELKSKFKNDWLYYPRLGIEAPIDWEVKSSYVIKLMPHGLIHAAGTALPEQGGNVVIGGHSSYFSWSKGKYKSVFAPLVKAQEGDEIIIKKKDTVYLYKVGKIFEIPASGSITIKRGSGEQKILDLMTCVPIGTSWRRLIVEAPLKKAI